MSLIIRMVFYFIGAMLAGYGFASFDAEAGTLTISLRALSDLLGAGGLAVTGGGLFAATFGFSRIAKAWGWKT
jgi:hypothetical protein